MYAYIFTYLSKYINTACFIHMTKMMQMTVSGLTTCQPGASSVEKSIPLSFSIPYKLEPRTLRSMTERRVSQGTSVIVLAFLCSFWERVLLSGWSSSLIWVLLLSQPPVAGIMGVHRQAWDIAILGDSCPHLSLHLNLHKLAVPIRVILCEHARPCDTITQAWGFQNAEICSPLVLQCGSPNEASTKSTAGGCRHRGLWHSGLWFCLHVWRYGSGHYSVEFPLRLILNLMMSALNKIMF